MTAYVTIPDTSIETGKPIRTVDGRALRDNPIAMAEGASGAPKFTGVQGPVVDTGGLYDDSVTITKIVSPTSGSSFNIHRFQDTQDNTNSTVYDDINARSGIYSATALTTGIITIKLEHKVNNNAYDSYVRVIKNGVLVSEWINGAETIWQTRTVNVSIDVGDLITIQHRISSSPGISQLRNVRATSGIKIFALA